MKGKTVHIVGGYKAYHLMFTKNNWVCVDNVEDADLVQFCGGEDVSPCMYKEKKHHTTFCNAKRDLYEKRIFELAVENGCAIAGICRGGQFVHVMNGGRLYQNVDGHALSGTHRATINVPELVPLARTGLLVSSTHHQMMREGKGVVVLVADISTKKETGGGVVTTKHMDVEAVYHEKTNSFSYQPHPEFFDKHHMCQRLYFDLVNKLLFKVPMEGDNK